MKQTAFIFCVLFLFSQYSFGQEKDFRKANWGMNKAEVEKTEKESPSFVSKNEDMDFIVYEGNVADLDCDIYYSFTKDKLTVGGYNFKQDYTNKILYIDDYKSLQELLTKKYGKPIEDQVVWNDNTYKNNKDKWDKALEAGHMKMLSSWETSKTKIDLNLSGVTSSVHITLSYKSKKNNDLNKSSKESKSLEGL